MPTSAKQLRGQPDPTLVQSSNIEPYYRLLLRRLREMISSGTFANRLPRTPAAEEAPVRQLGGVPGSARALFDQYDTNRDGVLDQAEVAAMIEAIGYEVDASYVGGVMDIFGRFDTDNGGTIDLSEFSRLWAHLGQGPLAAEEGEEEAQQPRIEAAAARQPLGGVPGSARALFDQYDTNRDGEQHLPPVSSSRACVRAVI